MEILKEKDRGKKIASRERKEQRMREKERGRLMVREKIRKGEDERERWRQGEKQGREIILEMEGGRETERDVPIRKWSK